ncbi:phage protein [Vibrio neptunius]|uniref:Phage protein n=1 Tax=Vibrio neptunius TaxID=170651 RepID=A0ABS3AA30_9VIBR|nr:phage protein [Vibrio neptunius]MBN3495886.1 phage protein [Vibrio neptunius]MBN3518306.1 phage protein [Vibrio neptunius]MBN3552637.1 phage protein [Vibrio neptunius]MBN3580692.1 phage protein [Vibrio neptunius]MCH9874358.1 phage protein [Vibrio neptunius]
MITPSFHHLLHQQFMDLHQAAAFFHVQTITVKRWISGHTPVNPLAEKLLNIKARGYLPLDERWDGFRVQEQRATLITPERREFSPKELLSFAHWRDEHRQLVELHGHIEYPKYYPPKENLMPFSGGGHRRKLAPWVPTKSKSKMR